MSYLLNKTNKTKIRKTQMEVAGHECANINSVFYADAPYAV